MKAIQLVYAQSVTSVKEEYYVQEIEFAVLVKNLAFSKKIAVHWAGDDEVWHVLPACYAFQAGQGCERWLARMNFSRSATASLPGKIRFALQYLVAEKEYWDNNSASNYSFTKGTGVLLGSGVLFTHLGRPAFFSVGETVQLEAAVHCSLQVRRVFARWTTDKWKTYRQTPCYLQRVNNFSSRKNSTPKSNDKAVSVWDCRIKTSNAFRLEYVFGCDSDQGEIWDNNLGINYKARHSGLRVLTLNLHCWQETDQNEKFGEIARAIHEMDIDIVCLQEVGEEWHDGKGNRQTNAAAIILDCLQKLGYSYHLFTDWSHIGFALYREGSAILSKQRLLKQEAAYVSAESDIHNIHSRKIVMAQIDFPAIGVINVFSVHLSWWEEGFKSQFEKLRRWASTMESDRVVATLLCGDFNSKAGSRGYMLIADGKDYEDQFLKVTSPAVFAKIFRETLPGREAWLADDGRIDYIFAKKNSRLRPKSARILFSGQDYKRVSDHVGYLVEFEPEA